MPTITKSIGTSSRDYSTITLWEADLDDDTPYDAADDAVGECYNDSAFDEAVTINGGGTLGLNSVKLSVASGERFDGTAGTGARIDKSGGTGGDIVVLSGIAVDTTFEWLEVTRDNITSVSNNNAINAGFTAAVTLQLQRLLVHNFNLTASGNLWGIRQPGASTNPIMNIHDVIIYGITSASTFTPRDCVALDVATGTGGDKRVQNITVHNVEHTYASQAGPAYALRFTDSAKITVRNCIATDAANAGSGASDCYSQSAPSSATVSHNAASDTTASGTGSLDSITTADQYVSTTGGSEDLHLKSGADAIDAGTDLGTTPSGVEIDIDGRDRDAEGDTWDMGAHEFVAAILGGGFSRVFLEIVLPEEEEEGDDGPLPNRMQTILDSGAMDRRRAFARHALRIISRGQTGPH